MPTRSDMHPPADWMSERPILYTELQAASSPGNTSESGVDRLAYASMVARPSTRQGVAHSSSSPMVARFEGPVRRSGTPAVADADADGYTVVKKKRSATNPKAVIGTESATTIKAKAGRFTAVFVSRRDPDTTEVDMESFVQETQQLASTCTKLKSKYYSHL